MNSSGTGKFKRTTMVTWLTVAILLGIGLARFLPSMNTIGLFLLFGWHVIFIRKFPKLQIITLILLGFGAGQVRGMNVHQKLIIYQKLQKQTVVISGVVVGDGHYDQRGELVAEASHVKFLNVDGQTAPGSIQIGGYGLNTLNRGDLLLAKGKLYPGIGAYQASLKFAEISVTGHQPSWPDNLRRKFSAALQNALPEPQASFAMGLLVGQRSTLPKYINDQLLAVGLTHLIAVSGYNVSIILQAVRQLFSRRSKFQTAAAMVGLLALFLAITGLSASIVRAAMVSLLSLGAWYFGRNFKSLLIILLPAAITAWVNPIYVWSDIGWYLSFLSFFGVIVVAPLLLKRLNKTKPPKIIGMVLIESLAAQAMTLPYVWWVFHKSSMIALASNLAIIPFVPLAMLMSFLAGGVSLLLPILSGVFALPASLILTYMLDTIGALAALPNVMWHSQISLIEMIILYCVFLSFIIILWIKNRGKAVIIKLQK